MATTFPVMTEGAHRVGAAVMMEANGNRSREDCKVPASTTILTSGLVARVAVVADVATVAAADAGNTGNATIAMNATATKKAVKDGIYRGVALTATTVKWEDPDGVDIGTSTHGVLFDKDIRVTITAGGTPNVAGDRFTVEVRIENADYTVAPYNPAGTDGTEKVFGYAPWGAVTGVGQTQRLSVICRDAELNGKCIDFASANAVQKQNAMDDLAKAGVIVRF